MVKDQYEKWPYPNIPYFARLHRDQVWQINAEWLQATCGHESSAESKIWIAGCGTFQPYAFSRANPKARILATDLSQHSIKIAKKRLVLHRVKNVELSTLDLNREEEYPNDQFDLIECYGVLMSVKNPFEVLQHFKKRLKPNGVLRIMVYPYYGRQRIFQIQRLAKLLGLHFSNNKDPKKLKWILLSLPKAHPLRYAFENYSDAKNIEGIVDGFLHASDRGFSGVEISDLIDRAGYQLSYCMHRPWGQPREMAEKLELSHKDTAFMLHYLDLWQELKTNYTFCLTHSEFPKKTFSNPHPLFYWKNHSLDWRHRLRLLRMGVTGMHLENRTDEKKISLKPKTIRELIKGERGLVSEKIPSLSPLFQETSRELLPRPLQIEKGERVRNPFYHHLFEAYEFKVGLPSLETQIQRWEKWARPLENEKCPWGLTPYGTYQIKKSEIDTYLFKNRVESTHLTWAEVRLEDEGTKFKTLMDFLPEKRDLPEESLRELWVLLFSYPNLFMKIY